MDAGNKRELPFCGEDTPFRLPPVFWLRDLRADVKAGLDAFSKSLAQELAGREILVNSVAPGFIDTEMTSELPEEVKAAILARIPQQRMGRAEEVADVVAFLATRGSYVNGSVIHVNGGMFGG